MADNKDPFAEFGGSLVTKDKDPFAEFGGSKLRGKPLDTDLPTGTQTSKRGFEPFLPQVPTKTPSVLTPKGQVGYQEQVKDFKPIAQKQPPLPKVEKPLSNLESIKNTVYNVANSLKGVLPRLSLTSVDVFEKVIGKDLTGRLASLPRIEFSNDGVDVVTGRTPEQIRNESIQSLDYLNTQVAPTAGIVENARNFNIPGLAAGVIDAAGGLVSTIIPSALSGGSLLVTEMVGGGLYDYNTAKAKSKGVSTEELYKRGDADFGVPAAIGGVGYAMERIGLKGFTNAISKKLAGSGFKKALLLGTEWNKEGLTEWVQVGLDEANVALANGLSVEDAAIAAADKMTSVQGLEAYAKGFAGSAAASSTARGLKRLVSPKNKTKASELEQQKNQSLQDLANENIPIEAKNAILDVLENTNEQIDDLVNIDRKEIEQLSESQAGRVGEINAKIEDIDLAINDVNISESTKSILEKQKQELDSELDDIIATPEIKLAKPTFDTKEQLVEEIREVEKEFNETGDSAEYQLKINDLNTRLENLVPAPEEVSPVKTIYDKDGNPTEIGGYEVVQEAESVGGERVFMVVDEDGNERYLTADGKELLLEKQGGKNAVQVETAGQVPVLTEATVGEEVEQGKPQPKAKVVTEEGVKAEEVGGVGVGGDEKFTAKGGNKVVDEKGEPITVYHTTKAKNISEFKTSGEIETLGGKVKNEGAYFTPIKGEYANKGGNEYAVQISIKNPYITTDQIESAIISPEKRADLISKGHDGVILMRNGKPAEYVVFDKSQIKAAEQPTQEGKEEVDGKYKKIIESIPVSQTIDGVKIHDIKTTKEIADILGISTNSAYSYLMSLGDDKASRYGYLVRGNWQPIEGGSNPKAQSVGWQISSSKEQTTAQEVKRLRAEEQAELNAAIPNADQYLTDGKVDRAKIADAKDLKKFDEIYDEYDRLITPLLPKKEAPAKTDILPKYKKKSIAEWFNKGLNATSIFEGGEIHPEDATKRAAWRSMGGSEFIKLLGGEEIGGETKKGGYFGDNPAIASAQKGEGKYLVEFGGKRVEFETTVVKVSSKDITGVWKYENGSWNKLSKEAVEDLIPKAQTEKEPQAEPTPAKPKAEPRLKPRVETRLKFTKAIELFNDISATKGGAKKRTLSSKRRTFLEQNPSIKYIDDNWKSISKQLEDKGLLKKEGNCP